MSESPRPPAARTVAIVPALDEEVTIAATVAGLRPHVDRVIVVDNGSRDRTAERASAAGADVVSEPTRGYGRACLAGLARARALSADVVLFADGDGSDDPADAGELLRARAASGAAMVLGVRVPGLREPGAMTGPQRFGNWLAPFLLRRLLGAPFHDMPPLKACDARALERLDLRDTGHGFTIELLIKAHRAGLDVREVPVRCLCRAGGESKVSGTIRGSVRAGVKIVTTVLAHAGRR
ncbi:MAG: glycosyltransferase family 2 protein [Polyangiaceae bacterium]